ncbi:MAG: polysaccharide biosynthesis protein [Rubripirellula sp.]
MNAIPVSWRRHLPKRIYVLVIVHMAMFALSYETALRLRFDMAVPVEARNFFWKTLPWLLGFKLMMFHYVGSLHGWWRYITFTDLAALLRVSTLATISIAFVDYLFVQSYQIPRSVLLLDWGITILLIGGLRSATRLVREIWWPAISLQGRKPALVIGAVQGGEILARQIHASSKLDFRVVGFLDEDRSRYGTRLSGIPFLGSPNDAVGFAQEYESKDLLIISNSMPGDRLRELVQRCRKADIAVKMIPWVEELVNGSFKVQVRDVNIDDLLRREPVELDTNAIRNMLSGKRVMVTGAGGSIGSEICRQIAKSNPARLVLVEQAENSLFEFDREMKKLGYKPFCVSRIADICDQERMRSLFETEQPEIVFHAAAHKHVPMMEENPTEAVKNNVLATADLAAMCDEFEVERFVMISTDKAVSPTSIMGVSKQLAERFVHSHTNVSKTKFVVVRFGNVLDSNGSVVPIFKEQIRNGGPVTITHPDMTRFFMTIPEASQLVLQASAMGKGGEIFVLDMGEQVKILDLAQDLIRLSGLSLDEINIEYIGVRPGEKLYEELYMENEEMLQTSHAKLRMAYHQPFSPDELHDSLEELRSLISQSDEIVRQRICEMAIDYRPTSAAPISGSQPRPAKSLPALAGKGIS